MTLELCVTSPFETATVLIQLVHRKLVAVLQCLEEA